MPPKKVFLGIAPLESLEAGELFFYWGNSALFSIFGCVSCSQILGRSEEKMDIPPNTGGLDLNTSEDQL